MEELEARIKRIEHRLDELEIKIQNQPARKTTQEIVDEINKITLASGKNPLFI